MDEFIGWPLDVYPHSTSGVTVWLIESGSTKRRCLQAPFRVTIFAAGPDYRLRELWRFLRNRRKQATLSRQTRRELVKGDITVMGIEVEPIQLKRTGRLISTAFPDLVYYNLDMTVPLFFAAAMGVKPLVKCRVRCTDDQLIEIEPVEDGDELEPDIPPLRVLTLEPNCDPNYNEPTHLQIGADKKPFNVPMGSMRRVVIHLQAALRRHDPDVVVTRYGDSWLLPKLLAHLDETGRDLPFNRDLNRAIQCRRSISYTTYGQTLHQAQRSYFFGRWHIDRKNAMQYGEMGIQGIIEQARMTGLPVQETARRSPGAGIAALQTITALKQGVLVPHKSQQSESFRSLNSLIRGDRGGMVYQPTIGLHRHVVALDFSSMYPSLMVKFNISPETVNRSGPLVPELGIPIDQRQIGIVPEAIRPVLLKRLRIKRQMKGMSRFDCRYKRLKNRLSGLKWLLVVSYGYLRFHGAKFSLAVAHEAVTAYGRECLLQAKEIAEEMGFELLHMYVDCLWVKQDRETSPEEIEALITAIEAKTGLPISLDGYYAWIAFLSSRRDTRIPVPNRYFGFNQQQKELKVRGIELRRRDTPLFIAQLQTDMLNIMSKMYLRYSPQQCLSQIWRLLAQVANDLRHGAIRPEELLVHHRLSRELDEYRAPSAGARAAVQLLEAGKERRPGQIVQFLYMRGDQVHAWDLGIEPDMRLIDVKRYAKLMVRAASNILQVLEVGEDEVQRRLSGNGLQLALI